MASQETSWLGCRECGVAHPLIPRAHTAAELIDELTAAVAAFLEAHAGHRITHLRRSEDGQIRSSLPIWDPRATLHVEVTDGRTAFVLTATRGSIDEPRRYSFREDRPTRRRTTVAVNALDIRRTLALAFHPDALPEERVDRFLQALEELLDLVDPQTLRLAFDDADDPSVSIAPLPDGIYTELTARCAAIFPATDLARVLAFLHENRSENGALGIRVRREMSELTELSQT